ncbi:hypothetical protein KAR91_64785 [Candidatus Pacearchaeota archaeon]|nr:hypothetical protein [Candidatus Pacearchaeota archaeon]
MKQSTVSRRIREHRQIIEQRVEKTPEPSKFEAHGNTATITGPPGQLMTLEELLDATGVDLDVWKVDRYLVNKWPISRKHTVKDLEWLNGVVDGFVKDDGLFHTIDQFQVKAWLVREKPIELFPTVQPVEVKISLPDDRIIWKEQDMPLGYTMVVPDIHVGFYIDFNTGKLQAYHDRGALGLVLDVARDYEVDQVIFLGDNLDLPDWSDKFIRSPEFRNVTQPAIDELAWWLGQFRQALPDSKIVYHEGNHENRMLKARQSNMIAAYDIRPASKVEYPPALSVPSLLELDKLDIQWVGNYPDGEYWINDNLVTLHGARARAGAVATAKAMLAIYDTSVIFGHVHRMEMGIRTIKVKGGTQVIKAVCPGALCMMDGTVPGHTTSQDWSQGFGMVYNDTKGHNIIPVEINNDRAVFGGKIYHKNYDYLEALQQDLTHWRF